MTGLTCTKVEDTTVDIGEFMYHENTANRF